jgi:acyl carrier protein
VDLQRQFFEKLDAQLFNRYGPTETTISVTSWTCEPSHSRRSVPIGRPMAGARIHVLDARWELVPLGAAGELVLGGPPVGRGYRRRPELTAPVFVPDPWSGEAGGRAYRTGDLARHLVNGDVEFLGRRDHQVKIRGFRVELGEIESVLEAHPAVHEAVVTERAAAGGRQLVAHVAGDAVTSAELRRYLAGHLPDYMVPHAVVVLGELPKLPSGKIDRQSLPEPEWAGAGEAALLDPLEEVVAGIWSEVLGLPADDARRVNRESNFFELGGHSLLATQVLSRLRETLSSELALREIFEAATLEELARRVERARRGFELPPLVAQRRDRDLALSFAQQRLWFADQLRPGDPSYNVPIAVRLRGRLDAAALAASLVSLGERHEVLRTVFAAVDGEPVQRLLPADSLGMQRIRLHLAAGGDLAAIARKWVSAEGRRPFDLARGPLARAHLLDLGEDDHVLLLTLHHIVADGWSTGILVRELAVLYEALSQGVAPALEELTVQYADFAHWQRSWLRGEVLEENLAWWRRQLTGAPARLELPTDRARPELLSYHGALETFQIGDELHRGLLALGRREGATLFMTLLAAFQVLLARLSGQDDLVVGTNVAGRGSRDLEPLVGFFVNNLALRARLADDMSFRAFLHQTRETSLAAFEHQDLPFEMLVEDLRLERSPGHAPLFQVLFLYQNLPPRPEIRIADLTLEPLAVEDPTSKFDLSLFVDEAGEGLRGTFAYSTDLLEAATICGWIGNYLVLLKGIVQAPDLPLSDLSLAEEQHYEELIDAFNVEL